MTKKQAGFTLIELLVVIAIIGILSTLSIIALSNARAKSRDAKRVADIKQISTALDLYYADYGYYPTIITPGNPLVSSDGTKTYIDKIPNNPSPRNDSGCGDNNYTYSSTSDNTNYTLNFCLGTGSGTLTPGINSTSSSGLGSAPGLVGWWRFDEGSGTTAYDSSGNKNNATIAASGPTWISGSPCRVNKCLRISDGNWNAGVAVSNSSSLNITGAATITGWIYAYGADINGNPTMSLIQKSAAYYVTGNDWGSKSIFGNSFPLAANLGYGVWYYISGTVSDSGVISYYINGLLAAPTQTRSMPLPTSSYGLGLGSRDAYRLNGMLSDVRIYNRELSAQEILALYNATK